MVCPGRDFLGVIKHYYVVEKSREEESGRAHSPGVLTYLWDTPDNVLGLEQ